MKCRGMGAALGKKPKVMRKGKKVSRMAIGGRPGMKPRPEPDPRESRPRPAPDRHIPIEMMRKGKKVPGKIKGYFWGKTPQPEPKRTPAPGYPRELTDYEKEIAKMSPWARQVLEERAKYGPNPEAGYEGIAKMSPYNRDLLERKGHIKPQSGGASNSGAAGQRKMKGKTIKRKMKGKFR